MEDYKQKYLKLCEEIAELRFFNVPTDSPSLREAKDFGESLKYDGRIIKFKHHFLKLRNIKILGDARLIQALSLSNDEVLSMHFIDYDTAYMEGDFLTLYSLDLSSEKILLIFKDINDLIFTTLRDRYKGEVDRLDYYRANTGKEFKIQIGA